MADQTRLPLLRHLTLAGLAVLLLSLSLWQFVRPGGSHIVLWAIQVLPLGIFIPGLIRNKPRVYIGFCFVLLLYFIKGVEGVFHPARAWIDYLLLFFSVFLFITAMLTSRWLQQHSSSTEASHAESP